MKGWWCSTRIHSTIWGMWDSKETTHAPLCLMCVKSPILDSRGGPNTFMHPMIWEPEQCEASNNFNIQPHV